MRVIGYIGNRDCVDLIFQGLQKLEYRGYDSAGIAVLGPEKIEIQKAKGKLSKLEPLLTQLPANTVIGMGHTRWATHGKPSTENAHPHCDDEVAIVHNGIIENFEALKSDLIESGAKFSSETDTEVILHLFKKLSLDFKDVHSALMATLERLEGAFALGLMSMKEPEAIYVAKQGSPMVLGVGDHESFFASDALPLVPYTDQIVFLEDGQVAKLQGAKVDLWNFHGEKQPVVFESVSWKEGSSDKDGFKHFMLKEIYQQPSVMDQGIKRFANLISKEIHDDALGFNNLELDRIKRVHIIGCGTSYYSGLVGKYDIEKLAKLPVSVELASEFRYREPYLDEDTLVIAMTQSGETADTLASVKHAKSVGCQVLSICNVHFSSIPREANATIYMECGPEIGVASTKAFTQMVLCLHFFSYALAKRRGLVSDVEKAQFFAELGDFSSKIKATLELNDHIESTAKKYFESDSALFIGRASLFPIALEGALKLKEISYIHAEGYAGALPAELKHGPIALIDRHMPVVALCPKDPHYEKMISNIEEIRARQGKDYCFW